MDGESVEEDDELVWMWSGDCEEEWWSAGWRSETESWFQRQGGDDR